MSLLITVFGSTGAQGAPVVQELLRTGHRVRAVARDRGRVVRRFGAAVEAASADLDDTDQVAAVLRDADGAFAHLPIPTAPDALTHQLESLLRAAQQARLPSLVYSTSGFASERFLVGVPPGLVAAAIAATQAVLESGIPAIVLQPTVYLENLHFPPMSPRLRGEGVLEYPPLDASRRLSWTAQSDQARFAVAAFGRPDLRGQAFEIATPGALTGTELAARLAPWVGREVRFQPPSPAAFADHLTAVFGSRDTGEAITDLYRAVAQLPPDGAVIDAEAVAARFGLALPGIAEHIAAWPRS